MKPLRIGILGAARITPEALVRPAALLGHGLVAIAARDRSRAEAFASEHGVAKVHETYQAVIDDPDVDVIYNPLPNGLHGPWNIRALQAGKHVLSEKPSASNADEARAVAREHGASGVKFMEAFHYRYHPLMNRLVELAENKGIGEIEHVEVVMGFPIDNPDDPRWDFDLAGGSLMDVGCYALHGIRSLGGVLGGEPRVTDAKAVPHESDPRVDSELYGDLVYPSGATAHFRSSFVLPEMTFTMHLRGTSGEALAHNFVIASLDDRITVVTGGESTTEHHGDKTSYAYQLDAFAQHVHSGGPIFTDSADALVQSEMMDACYVAAGLPLRPSSSI